VGIDCPFCSPRSGHFRLGINLAKGFCSCWHCGGKRLGSSLAESTGRPLGEILRLIEGLERGAGVTKEKPRGKLVLPSRIGPLLAPHRDYLERRGFDPDEITRTWGVRGIHIHPRLAWRLWIPVVRLGETVSWTTRSIGDGEPRYVTASAAEESFPAKHTLYGIDKVGHAIVIVEGPIDAWAIGPGAVATMGLACTREQFDLMCRCPVRAVCFDNEPAARRRQEALCDALAPFPGETHSVELRTGKDAAEVEYGELEEIRKRFLGG
jgi:hypothetical protein